MHKKTTLIISVIFAVALSLINIKYSQAGGCGDMDLYNPPLSGVVKSETFFTDGCPGDNANILIQNGTLVDVSYYTDPDENGNVFYRITTPDKKIRGWISSQDVEITNTKTTEEIVTKKILLTDISDHKNKTAIQYLLEKGVINGYEDQTFRPNNTLLRKELMKILVESSIGTPNEQEYQNCFPDIESDWSEKYICYAYSQGWVGGYNDGTFKPDKTVSNIEALKMLMESQKISVNSSLNSKWYTEYINKALEINILGENITESNKNNNITRGALSENMYRILLYKK